MSNENKELPIPQNSIVTHHVITKEEANLDAQSVVPDAIGTDRSKLSKRKRRTQGAKTTSLTIRMYKEQEELLTDILKRTNWTKTAAVGKGLEFLHEFVLKNFPTGSVGGEAKWDKK